MKSRAAARGECISFKMDNRIPKGFIIKVYLASEVGPAERRAFPKAQLFYMTGDRRALSEHRWVFWSDTYAGAVMAARAKVANLSYA